MKSNQAVLTDALSWSDLLIQGWDSSLSLSPQMMMRNGKLFLMRWFAKYFDHHLDSSKLSYNVKLEAQNNIADVDVANKSLGFSTSNLIDMQLHEVKLFDTIMPKQMAEYQKKDTQLSHVYECVSSNSKPKLSEIHCVRSKPVCRLLLQFRLTLINMGCPASPFFSG